MVTVCDRNVVIMSVKLIQIVCDSDEDLGFCFCHTLDPRDISGIDPATKVRASGSVSTMLLAWKSDHYKQKNHPNRPLNSQYLVATLNISNTISISHYRLPFSQYFNPILTTGTLFLNISTLQATPTLEKIPTHTHLAHVLFSQRRKFNDNFSSGEIQVSC